jgi:hypothetical protein
MSDKEKWFSRYFPLLQHLVQLGEVLRFGWPGYSGFLRGGFMPLVDGC